MDVTVLLIAAVLGGIGGGARGCVGILKLVRNLQMGRKRVFRPVYLGITIIASAVIGAFTGLFFPETYQTALLAGYAGTDLLEGMTRVFKGK